MPEWRKDPVVDRWVAIATERGKRPSEFKCGFNERTETDCPLCTGYEERTPPEVLAFRRSGTPKDTPGWWIRVVPNKFPAVKIEEAQGIIRKGVYSVMGGLGAHEVVVEIPGHMGNLDTMSEKQVEEIIWAWRERSLDLRRDHRFKYIQIFKNYGSTAGASLEHAHSQIIATPMVPVEVKGELEGFQRYMQATGRCVFCDLLAQEAAERERLVIQEKHFFALTPFASRFPFELWVVPAEHQEDFAAVRAEQVRELARVLRTCLRKLSLMLCDPPYNLVLHSSPVNEPGDFTYHWHLEIIPRLTIIAGFELGTGYYINPTPPELAARYLRETEVDFAEYREVG
ncbi:MAG: galactose-1-phosphate uridylyltransferase [Desulfotomaculales bacterium]